MEDDLNNNNLLDPYDLNILYKSIKWRQPPMEDDLKILKVEYLSNLLVDHTQNKNLS